MLQKVIAFLFRMLAILWAMTYVAVSFASTTSKYISLDEALQQESNNIPLLDEIPGRSSWPGEVEESSSTAASSLPQSTNTLEDGRSIKKGTAVYVLADNENGSLQAYNKDYPGASSSALSTLTSTQAQYEEELASIDVNRILGRPISSFVIGNSVCRNGIPGQIALAYHAIKSTGPPKAVIVVRYCNDGLQSAKIQSVP